MLEYSLVILTSSYEGTGRSLSLKLIDQLRKQSGAAAGQVDPSQPSSSGIYFFGTRFTKC